MAKIKLTQSLVVSATCPEGKQKMDYFDAEVPGLLLKVMPTGKRTFYVRYLDSHSRTKERRLCDAAVVRLDDARNKAKQLLARIALGENPFKDSLALKQVPTLQEFFDSTYLPHIQQVKKSWKLDEAQLRIHVLPVLGRMYLDEISASDVQKLYLEHSKCHKVSSSNRMFHVLRRLFTCALNWETPGLKVNPAERVKKLRDKGYRDRYLNAEELRALWDAVNESVNPALPHMVRMLILTGARKNEVAQARWRDIDLVQKRWVIPENKSGKVRYLPLSDNAIAVLGSVEKIPGCDYVFPNPETLKPYKNFYHAWNAVRKAVGIEDCRIHDLRHTYASYLVNIGVSIYEVKDLLGHASVVTTQRYAHLSQGSLLKATNRVSSYVDQALSITPSKLALLAPDEIQCVSD